MKCSIEHLTLRQPPICESDVREIFNNAIERYSQIQVNLNLLDVTTVDPPSGVIMTDGVEWVDVNNGGTPINEMAAINALHGTSETTDIHLFFVRQVTQIGTSIMGMAENPKYIAFISIQDNLELDLTVAHELGHLLTQEGHYDGSIGSPTNAPYPDSNLMRSEAHERWPWPDGAPRVNGCRRLYDSQESIIRNNSHVY